MSKRCKQGVSRRNMTYKYKNQCSTSLVNREIQIQTQKVTFYTKLAKTLKLKPSVRIWSKEESSYW